MQWRGCSDAGRVLTRLHTEQQLELVLELYHHHPRGDLSNDTQGR